MFVNLKTSLKILLSFLGVSEGCGAEASQGTVLHSASSEKSGQGAYLPQVGGQVNNFTRQNLRKLTGSRLENY